MHLHAASMAAVDVVDGRWRSITQRSGIEPIEALFVWHAWVSERISGLFQTQRLKWWVLQTGSHWLQTETKIGILTPPRRSLAREQGCRAPDPPCLCDFDASTSHILFSISLLLDSRSVHSFTCPSATVNTLPARCPFRELRSNLYELSSDRTMTFLVDTSAVLASISDFRI